MSVALIRGLRLLERVQKADGALSFTELNDSLGGISRASLSRLLKTLLSAGYLCQDQHGRYACGERLAQFSVLGSRKIRGELLQDWSPLMRRLSHRYDLTFILLERVGDYLVNIRREMSEFSMGLQGEGLVNLDWNEPWRVTLAAFDDSIFDRYREQVDPELIGAIRSLGYCDERGTRRAGVRRLAFPVYSRVSGDLVGVLGIAGSTAALTQEVVDVCVGEIASRGPAISR